MQIKLIVGLGNPGSKYTKTRHNAGFWLLDDFFNLSFSKDKKLNAEIALKEKVYFLKPQTFMNLTGDSVQKTMSYYKILPSEILIIHDELDFPAGKARFKQGGGHGGHNGLRDIIKKINTGDFLRLRIGIGHPGDRNEVVNYVLKSPSVSEKSEIDTSLQKSYHAIEHLLDSGLEKATQYLHS